MFSTNTKQRADPKSYKKNVTAEVIYSSANKRLESQEEKIYVMSFQKTLDKYKNDGKINI